MVMFFSRTNWTVDIQISKHCDRKKGRRDPHWDVNLQSFSWLLRGIYSCVDVWVCQALTLNLWVWVETSSLWICGFVSLGGIDGCPRGIGRRKVCVYELETVVPPQVMTTCAPSAWFMDTYDLSMLSWICSRTDRMQWMSRLMMNVFSMCRELLFRRLLQYIFVGLPMTGKKKKKSVFAQTLGSSLLIVCIPLSCCASVHPCIRAYLLSLRFWCAANSSY